MLNLAQCVDWLYKVVIINLNIYGVCGLLVANRVGKALPKGTLAKDWTSWTLMFDWHIVTVPERGLMDKWHLWGNYMKAHSLGLSVFRASQSKAYRREAAAEAIEFGFLTPRISSKSINYFALQILAGEECHTPNHSWPAKWNWWFLICWWICKESYRPASALSPISQLLHYCFSWCAVGERDQPHPSTEWHSMSRRKEKKNPAWYFP